VTRRTALLALAGAAAARGEVRYRTYSRCLPDYLAALAREAYERREASLAKLTNADMIRARQSWVRATFWQLTGGMPDRTVLNTRTVAAFERPGYKVEKLVYESEPGLVIPANLYIPTNGNPPYPGVLFQMGHSPNGKAADPYQKCCQGLARLGYVVLAFDPMGQGERIYYPKPGANVTRLSSVDAEHTHAGRQMLLAGISATRMQTWDAVRSLDVLASHPSVDPKRLASTGQSGGGTLTMFLIAVDDRLACAAVSSGNTENFAYADWNPPGPVDDAEQNFVGSGPLGFDRWDTLYPMAPKPLWIGVSARDFFGTYSPNYLDNGRLEFAKLKRVYERLGAADRIAWYETPLPHALSHDMRVQIYNFFERWLKGSTRNVAEPDVKPEPDVQLQVGAKGSVVADFGSKTPHRLVVARPIHKREAEGDPLRVTAPLSQEATVLGRATAEHGTVEAIEVQSATRVWLPAYVFVPRRESGTVLLLLEPRGRTAHWRESDLYPQLAAAGITACAFDVRGIGDLWPEVGRGNPYYTRGHSSEESYAWASIVLGRPLLSQRITDILAMAGAMRERAKRLVLAASGQMAVPALFAAARTNAIDLVYTNGALPSYFSLLEREDYTQPFANFVPGMLDYTDLPAVREQLGTRLKEGSAWDLDTLRSL
jgi:dienelactone hydrolase